MEKRRERDESVCRENRRVHAVSWGLGSSSCNGDDAPPKPSRSPAPIYATVGSGSSGDLAQTPRPTTYLVAPNSQVLAQLIKDAANRSDASLYTAPASAFLTFTVEFTNSPSVSPHKKNKSRNKQQPVYVNTVQQDISAAAVRQVMIRSMGYVAWIFRLHR